MSGQIDTIVWDLGGVLVDWSPTYVYDQAYFENEADREYFFSHICTQDWNEQQDAGYSLQKATQEKLAEFPDPKWQQPIRDFYGRWIEMLRGPLPDTVAIFQELKQRQQFKFFALTNWRTASAWASRPSIRAMVTAVGPSPISPAGVASCTVIRLRKSSTESPL